MTVTKHKNSDDNNKAAFRCPGVLLQLGLVVVVNLWSVSDGRAARGIGHSLQPGLLVTARRLPARGPPGPRRVLLQHHQPRPLLQQVLRAPACGRVQHQDSLQLL